MLYESKVVFDNVNPQNSTFKRILFLGTTGVGKQQAVTRLAQWYQNQSSTNWTMVDFEREYLYKAVAEDLFPQTSFENIPVQELRSSFLDAQQHRQFQFWEAAWNDLSSKLETDGPGGLLQHHIFLCIHGCYTRSHYGIRSFLDAYIVANDFKPDLIFTLVDDVYNAWWITVKRAQESPSANESSVGRPRLQDLINARRVELLIGDQIAHSCARNKRIVKNIMLPISHPIDTFAHCINHPTSFKVAYLSFPISMPREAQAEGVNKPMEEVSEFVREAYAMQVRNPRVAVLCPLGIDELPLTSEFQKADSTTPQAAFTFDRDKLRWPLDSLWSAEYRLGVTPDVGKDIDMEEMQEAAGSIRADVSFRDYRLVDQADFLLVFNPIYRIEEVSKLKNRDTVAKSVDKEIQYAKSHNKRVYIFQDTQYDPFQVVESQLGAHIAALQDRATMSNHPWDNLTTRKPTRKQLLDVLKG